MSSIQHTLAIIKPTAVKQGYIGGIIRCIEQAGFHIRALELTKLSEEEGKAFYAVHAEKPFYEELYQYISSGAVVPIVLAKAHAVADFRTLIGTTDPLQAAPNTIRKKFGISIGDNAIHGSDGVDNAAQEIAFFFPRRRW